MAAIRLEEDAELKIPSLLSTGDRLQVIGEKIKQIQVEIFRLEVIQKMNGHKNSDLVPGADQTYDTQRTVYIDGLKRIEICYPDYVDLILGAPTGA